MTITQFEKLLQEYGSSIYGFCCHLTGNRMAAEDLYQDAVLKAFSKLQTIRSEDKARNYILGIAVRLYKNQRRKHTETPASDQLVPVPDMQNVAEETEQQELYACVRRAVQGLPHRLREVTYLYYFSGLRTKEIVAVLHIPEGTVKSRLSKARSEIRKEMVDHGYETR